MEEATVVALAATGVTAVSIGTNAWSTWWNTRKAADQQREERRQQRLSGAYVQMLELAEKEGHYLQIRHDNLETTTWDEYGVADRKFATRPGDDERAKTVALASAFASDEVQHSHSGWLKDFDHAHAVLEQLEGNIRENYGPGLTLDRKDLQPFSDAVAAELASRVALRRAVNGDLRRSG